MAIDWWQTISSYLDEALELGEGERSGWLASLHDRAPELARELQMLLEEHRELAQERFLENGLTSPLTGYSVGVYTIVAPIGQGGMGSVWLAERSDGRFQRRAAVKFLGIARLSDEGVERFRREGTILARLSHPHIAQLLDAGVTGDGQPYLVLEYVEGEPIDRYCDRLRLDIQSRLRLFLDALSAVAHAHANLIVHRDIKPSNVLVRNDAQVKLLDFGIAKLLRNEEQPAEMTLLTREGGALTPEYAAPEQVTGDPITTATDVFGLGTLLYVLLTGQHPAGAGARSTAELIKAVVELEPPRPSDAVISARAADGIRENAERRAASPERLSRGLRGDLDTIVAKALKKNPRERYASVTALADDIRRYLAHEPIAARPDTFAYRASKFVRRNRLPVALGALAFAASLAAVVGTTVQARNARAQRDFAFRELSKAEAISDLNTFLLSDAAPSGKSFTVDDLLTQEERIVERQHDNFSANRVMLLVSIGRQYGSEDEESKARRVLTEAYHLSRGLPDASVRARAACALADTLARSGEARRAEELFQEGIAELPAQPMFALDRASCLLNGAAVARENGAPQDAIERVKAAQVATQQSPYRSDLPDTRVLMDLAESYRVAGQNREAVVVFDEAAARLKALGRDDTETAGTLLNNWGLALDQLGRPLEAEKLYRRAIDISRDDAANRAVSPMLLLNYARPLRELARLSEAAAYAEDAYSKAQQAGDEVVMNQSLIERARIYQARGDAARSEAMIEEVEPRLRRALPPGHYAFATIALEHGLIAQSRRKFDRALELSNQAVQLLETSIKAGHQGAYYLPIFLLARANIEIDLCQEAGAPLRCAYADRAVADASRALQLFQDTAQPGTSSMYLGKDYLALGRALAIEGKGDEAHEAFLSAVSQLEGALGAKHPETILGRVLAHAQNIHP